jgi:Na+:H+ antiporter, NhaA family
MILTKLFNDFFRSEKTGGFILIFATAFSLFMANSTWHTAYTDFLQTSIGGHPLVHWINDGLMTIFFLLIGLELEREIYEGELKNIRNAALPIFAAIGGMLIPATIFIVFNYGTPYQSGAGIPMATDIAFAIGVLSLLGNKVPASLKVFLAALAVIDDLGAIIVIAIFYTNTISIFHLSIALGIYAILIVLNRLKVCNITPYIIGGIIMWYFMLHSGIHATITGVLLAFAIPFGTDRKKSPSNYLEHFLHKPVAFFILPIFAIANTGITIQNGWENNLLQPASLGIILGLLAGKPLGIALFSYLAVQLKLASLPKELKWGSVIGTGLLGGIGFTMSIFITLLAFTDSETINNAKMAILTGSLFSGIVGFIWLKTLLKNRVLEAE